MLIWHSVRRAMLRVRRMCVSDVVDLQRVSWRRIFADTHLHQIACHIFRTQAVANSVRLVTVKSFERFIVAMKAAMSRPAYACVPGHNSDGKSLVCKGSI